MRTSISTANRYMLVGFILINLGLVIFMTEFAPESKLRWLLSIFIVLNLGIVLLYTIINTRYWREHDRLFRYFSSFIREKKAPENLLLEEEFDENARFLSLFKRTYVEHNLLKKDYAEFKKVFDAFIPREIHAEIGFRGYERIVLGTAERKRLTIMFLDIMRFSTVSEATLDPYRALLLLNIYFDGIGDIIYKHNGYIDRYLGDGILAVFDEIHTDSAIRAAMEIEEFIKKFQITTIGRQIGIGIGINTGNVILGTVGTKKRMDATVIGDVVNIASHLELMTRETENKILISENTLKSIRQPEFFSICDLGPMTIKGRKEPIQVHGVNVLKKEYYPEVSR